ncbi:pilus assembly protein [Spongiibacter taiwanensis]|uniref:TadE/TadG family type IV pilus assembly protein n=1 Tax=Spongiibacter taiwanensis TaxID=1748242 RepID=UPI002034AA06|nr:TadE/TadG family type IV pilus assembly protein [Spongiibacter taiwanensis]USA43589.1 pilus assembly protein [Spongiibacter taiwanensis]
MSNEHAGSTSSSRQRGAAAIELALILPVFIGIVYAIAGYGLAFLMVQSLTYASEDALRAALATECAAATCTEAELKPIVAAQVQASLPWLPASLVASATAGENFFSCDGTMLCTVRLSATPLIPGITLPLIGEVPDLPDQLVGRASLRL